jgi:hypothetical protein
MTKDQVVYQDMITGGPPVLLMQASLTVNVEVGGPQSIPVCFELSNCIASTIKWLHVVITGMERFGDCYTCWKVTAVFPENTEETIRKLLKLPPMGFSNRKKSLLFLARYDSQNRKGDVHIGMVNLDEHIRDNYHILLKE